MKLGDVLKKEREKRGIEAHEMADRLKMNPAAYRKIEEGDKSFEQAAQLIFNFSKVADIPVNGIFYPCGLPFQELDDYP